MTTTLEPAGNVGGDDPTPGPPRSALRAVLAIALAAALMLAVTAGVVFVLVHKSPPAPAPAAQQAPAAPVPSATATPDEQFLAAWHQVAPGVAARRSDNTWTQIGVGTCNLIGVPGATPDVLSRVLGSNPALMSVAEGAQFLGVASAKLCPEKVYVAGPALVLPNLPRPSFPDFSVTVPRVSVPSIPTQHVSPPKITVPSIPGGGHSSSGSSSSGGGGSSGGSQAPSIIKPPSSPPWDVHTEN